MRISTLLLMLLSAQSPFLATAQDVRPASPAVVMRPVPRDPIESTISFAGKSEVQISHDAARECSVLSWGATTWSFPAQEQVLQFVVSSDRTLAVLIVSRFSHRRAGWYYTGLLVLREKGGTLQASWHLMAEELREIDGLRRSVFEILEVDQFPRVKLSMSTDENPNPPTRVFAREEWWDILKYPLEAPKP
jgi:hypothetical protein